MDRLGQLWIEMFLYGELPQAPGQPQMLVISQEELRGLVKEAARILSLEKGWEITVEPELPDLAERNAHVRYWVLVGTEDTAAFVPTDAGQITVPTVYGLGEEECRCFSDFDEYRNSLLSEKKLYLCRRTAFPPVCPNRDRKSVV